MSEMTCAKCGATVDLEPGLDPTDYCHDCAQVLVEKMEAAIRKHLPALEAMAGQVLSPKENTFSRMVRDFQEALK